MMKRLKLVCSLLLVAMVVLMVTACGASGGGKGGPGAGDASQDPQSAALAWAKCMRENGVDIPDPKPQTNGGDVQLAPGFGGPMDGDDEQAFAAAKEACAEYAEDMGGVDGGAITEEDKQRMVDFARCMREQGVDMPDPDFDASDGDMGVEIDPNDPNFEAAQEACQEFSTSEESS